ncbi:MAG: hypothetical protein SWK90_16675 [Chloroflexota bacterium]|nr:hypothetical protein [Chloroflexota bacterium]
MEIGMVLVLAGCTGNGVWAIVVILAGASWCATRNGVSRYFPPN